ncbi:hypothetical protein RDI58_004159 [Solanum bulbocastanum]|uniref:Uncharacterized protein n=1 Tax=Solanum bulbocastanum TaxID=147425 RepID=A0AAN8TXB4_SOLBU
MKLRKPKQLQLIRKKLSWRNLRKEKRFIRKKENVMEKYEKGEEVYPKEVSVEKVEVNWNEIEKAEATPTDLKELVMEKSEK